MMVDFVEGNLPADLSEEVRLHVEACPECMSELEKVSSTSRVLRVLGRETVRAPDDLVEEISETIKKTGTWYFVRRYGIPAGIFAAVIAIVILAFAFGMAVFG